ncbi:hypothetical protein TNCV_1037631 [Trichonephila clavipes]|nr:hypothetical protein TNCV_1037631 [Trichonephila clavipes]
MSPVVSRSFGDRTISLGLAPILKAITLGVVRAFHLSSSSSTNLTRGLAAQRLFKAPSCHEGTIHVETYMSSPGFEPRPNGTAVSVANHYTGWASFKITRALKINKDDHREKLDYYTVLEILYL